MIKKKKKHPKWQTLYDKSWLGQAGPFVFDQHSSVTYLNISYQILKNDHILIKRNHHEVFLVQIMQRWLCHLIFECTAEGWSSHGQRSMF